MNSVLVDNLIEITYASQTSLKSEPLPLVANCSGTRVYVASQGWGKLWCWFYDLVEYFCGTSNRAENLKTSIKKTHELFQAVLKKYQTFLETYTAHLNRKQVEEAPLLTAKKAIRDWKQSIKPFVKAMKGGQDPRLVNLLDNSDSELAQPDPFDCPYAKTFSHCLKAIDLENLYPDLPLRTLMAVGTPNETLEESDKANLMRLIEQLNSNGKLRLVRRGLKGMVAVWNINRSPKINALQIHATLAVNGCTIYNQSEGNQSKVLSPGETIQFDDKTFTIDKHVSTSKDENQVNTYTLQGNDKQFLLAGKNRLFLHIRQIQEQMDESSQIFAKVQQVSENGKWALIAKAPLLSELLETPWKSTSSEIDENDKPLANGIAHFLKKCLDDDVTPENFNAIPWLVIDTSVPKQEEEGNVLDTFISYLSPSKQVPTKVSVKRLSSIDPFKYQRHFDFVQGDAFITACANGNEWIKTYLLKRSTLDNQPVYLYYKYLKEQKEKGTKIDMAYIRREASNYRICDSEGDEANRAANRAIMQKAFELYATKE